MLREFRIDARARRAHVNIDVVNVNINLGTTSSHHTCIFEGLFEYIRVFILMDICPRFHVVLQVQHS